MDQLKEKVTLHVPGEQAAIAVKQLQVILHWRTAVDLDLMAFYRAKDGRLGGVFSDNYPGGSRGSLSQFPFIQLSADAGVEGQSGDHEEVLVIGRLDELAEVYICSLNYTDAVAKRTSAFADYDGGVVVSDDSGRTVAVPLNATQVGEVAVIARIDHHMAGDALLKNENRILDLGEFFQTIPGADLLRASSPRPPTPPPPPPSAAAPVEAASARWIESVRLRAYERPYLDKEAEKELLHEAIAQGLSFDDARVQLLQVCEAERYALESRLEEQAAQILEQCIERQGEIDQQGFTDAVALAHRSAYGHLSDATCRQQVKALILAHQWPVRQGFLKGGHWFNEI
jgi:uncharacterized protein involved in tellurium resistance